MAAAAQPYLPTVPVPSVPSLLRVDVTHGVSATVVAVAGELDLASAPALDQVLEDLHRRGTDTLLLDLSAVEFMDSSGLDTLVRAHLRSVPGGRKFGVSRRSAAVARVLAVTGMIRLLCVATPAPSQPDTPRASR